MLVIAQCQKDSDCSAGQHALITHSARCTQYEPCFAPWLRYKSAPRIESRGLAQSLERHVILAKFYEPQTVIKVCGSWRDPTCFESMFLTANQKTFPGRSGRQKNTREPRFLDQTRSSEAFGDTELDCPSRFGGIVSPSTIESLMSSTADEGGRTSSRLAAPSSSCPLLSKHVHIAR